jgi:hypothetical protein
MQAAFRESGRVRGRRRPRHGAWIRRAVAVALVAAGASTTTGPHAQPNRQPPRYTRVVSVTASPDQFPFAALDLPNDVVDECDTHFFRNLHLLGPDGKEWPFLVDKGALPKGMPRPVTVQRTEAISSGVTYTFALPQGIAPEALGELHLAFRTSRPERVLNVETSPDGTRWSTRYPSFGKGTDAYILIAGVSPRFCRVQVQPDTAPDLVSASILAPTRPTPERGVSRREADLPLVPAPADDDAIPGAPHRYFVELPAAQLLYPEFRATTDPPSFDGEILFRSRTGGTGRISVSGFGFELNGRLNQASGSPSEHVNAVGPTTTGRLLEVQVLPKLGGVQEEPRPLYAVTSLKVSYGTARIVFRTPKEGRLVLAYGTEQTGEPPSSLMHEFLERPVEELAQASLAAPPGESPTPLFLDRTPLAAPPAAAAHARLEGKAPDKGGLTYFDLRCQRVPEDFLLVGADGNAIPFAEEDRWDRRFFHKVAFSTKTDNGVTVVTVPLDGELVGDLGCEVGWGRFALYYSARDPAPQNIEATIGPRPNPRPSGSTPVLGNPFTIKLAKDQPLEVYLQHGQTRAVPVSDVVMSTDVSRIFFVTRPGERVSLIRTGASPEAGAPSSSRAAAPAALVRAAVAAAGEALRVERPPVAASGGAFGGLPSAFAGQGTPKWVVGIGILVVALLCFVPFFLHLVRRGRPS